MSLISINSLGKDFGIKPLFNEVTFVIEQNKRIGLVGRNGSGKTTLLKIICGLEDPDRGQIVKRKGLNLQYVQQIAKFPEEKTAIDFLIESTNSPEHACKTLLIESGLNSYDTQIKNLSGGMQKRLALVRAFLEQADLIVLDEPTNHLDIPGILWLEQKLLNFNGSVLFVSHDRFFIEKIAESTVEIDSRFKGGYIQTPGGFSALEEKKQEVLNQLRSTKDSLHNKVRREIDWLRAGVKARTTKSKSRIDEAHRMINELQTMQLNERDIELGFSATKRKTKELIKLEKVSGGYNLENILWNNLSMTLYPGSRYGIVGPNGSGKTTLLKSIIGEVLVLKGNISRASNLNISYFSQMRDSLDPNITVQKYLADDGDSIVFDNHYIHVATWAKRFGFNPDQLKSVVSELSGGEQARLLLSKLGLTSADVLVFDEPTNDLDIPTLEILEKGIIEFPGAVLIVSHDRYLMSRVCTSILGFTQRGQLLEFADYLQYEMAWDEQSSNQKFIEEKKNVTTTNNDFFNKKEIQSLERKISTLEQKISNKQIELNLPENSANSDKLISIQSEIDSLSTQLEELMNRWFEISG
jgi:ATP-binding cassette subfamily F protein uup